MKDRFFSVGLSLHLEVRAPKLVRVRAHMRTRNGKTAKVRSHYRRTWGSK